MSQAAAPGLYEELTRRLEIYKQTLAAQDGVLRSVVKDNLTLAVNRLEIALLQLYKLAVFIRGDYDEREDDDLQKNIVASRSMADAQCSQRQVTSFQTDEIQQLQRDVQRALDQTKLEMDAIRQQAEQNQHDVEVWTRQKEEAADALQRAQDERENTAREREIGDIFLVQFFGGFAMGDVEGNMRKIEQERSRLNNAQEQWMKARNSLIEVMHRQNEVNVRRVALEQVAQQMPTLQVMTDGLNKDLAALLGGFTDLKDKATQLLLLIDEMKNRATVTMRQAYKKAMFAEGILNLCRMALIDGRVCDEVETITLEISSGYSGQTIPESVSKLLTEVGQAARETTQKSITG
ncbi:uncharacterized protein NECHADRAFT_82071 [Fusarium vanettenii 77-13-4]|uniref:Uncharacterized protein n=1 Tax=Fusarium vanettenii (strain ATCC MYA-4622 / CBS 123669 / FGSC 9596 / NRRL 45880 / 77-13-4) TaxID=660122 RepID=C7ZAE5_FUSV7|nr:uncharacterized protein NECHADRAFT_82071 [Fusarium vanettenii 77-13-4]EEU39261.1 hypothetical protein NECHADRAFT_82071 [Fusarium vanettenii 77-13-4]